MKRLIPNAYFVTAWVFILVAISSIALDWFADGGEYHVELNLILVGLMWIAGEVKELRKEHNGD